MAKFLRQGTPEEFRQLVSQGRWDHAVALLRWLDPRVAADAFMTLPFEAQRRWFPTLPIDLAATLVENLPYYDSYVLLRLRPRDEVKAVLNAMNPLAPAFEKLSDEPWPQISGGPPEAAERPAIRAVAPGRAIIEAKRIEVGFARALAVETGFVTASGGAWNASIVAEYFRFQGQTLSTGGLGAIVVTVNRLVWRRLFTVAATRFALEN